MSIGHLHRTLDTSFGHPGPCRPRPLARHGHRACGPGTGKRCDWRKMVHMSGIFTAYLQVSDLERSLSFYRDGLGLGADWNDGTLAVLRSPGTAAHTLVLREVGDGAGRRLGEVGVT